MAKVEEEENFHCTGWNRVRERERKREGKREREIKRERERNHRATSKSTLFCCSCFLLPVLSLLFPFEPFLLHKFSLFHLCVIPSSCRLSFSLSLSDSLTFPFILSLSLSLSLTFPFYLSHSLSTHQLPLDFLQQGIITSRHASFFFLLPPFKLLLSSNFFVWKNYTLIDLFGGRMREGQNFLPQKSNSWWTRRKKSENVREKKEWD